MSYSADGHREVEARLNEAHQLNHELEQQLRNRTAGLDAAMKQRDEFELRLTIANRALRSINRTFSLAALNDQRVIEGLPIYDDDGKAAA